MKIKMLETVRPDFLFLLTSVPADTILVCGEVYEATQNKHGAVCGICENGQKLGVKPGGFEIVEEGQTLYLTTARNSTVWRGDKPT